MSFAAIVASVVIFFQKNLVASLAIVTILLYLLFRKPKTFFIILFIALLLVGLLYLSMYLSSCKQIPLWQ